MNADKPPGDVDFPMTPRAKSYLNELAAAIRSIWPLNGGNVVVTDALGATGKIFNAPARKGGSGGADPKPFTISDDGTESGKALLVTSNLAGDVPDSLTVNVNNNDVVYGCVSYDTAGDSIGAVTSRTIGAAAALPADDNTAATFYYRIGSVKVTGGAVTGTNDAYGPIDATAYRDDYVYPPNYLIVWNGS